MLFYFLQQDVEAFVNLRYVTKVHLSTPRQQYDPETGLIQLSLKVPDQIWRPKQGLKKWDSDFRTFVEVCDLLSLSAKLRQYDLFL